MIFAEVIGDPIAQSKSPLIHNFWLDRLGIEGKYLRTRVAPDSLADFLKGRRADREWRGCNVTIPHKRSVIPMLDRLDVAAEAIGAVNCVVPEEGSLAGYNSDIDGVAAALDSTEVRGRKATVIGAGGGARAVVAYLAKRGAERIDVVARNAARAEGLRLLAPDAIMRVLPFERADAAFGGAAAIVNASPLGMEGAPSMPEPLIDCLGPRAADTTIFDLVATPAKTAFLAKARETGARAVDGLTMLIGQAERAFELFFGVPAPAAEDELRRLLAIDKPN